MSGPDRRRPAKPVAKTGQAATADVAALLRQGLHLHRQGRLDEAAVCYGRVLAVMPGQAQASHLLGLVEHQRGDNAAAQRLLQQALLATPIDAQRLADLGMVLNALQRPLEALDQLRRALTLRPGDARILNLMAAAYLQLGQPEDAVGCYREAVRSAPGEAAVHNNLGNALAVAGDIEAGIASYRRALELDRSYVDAHSNLGYALAGIGRLDEAIGAYDEALRLRPQHLGAQLNRGLALTRRGRLAEAGEMFRHAIALAPDFAELYLGYGDALVYDGRTAEGLAQYRLALERRPDHAGARSSLLFMQNYVPDMTPEQTLAEARRYGKATARAASSPPVYRNAPDPARRIRVGLVSGDLWTHAVANFLEGALPQVDREKVELFAYATASRVDATTERLRQSVPNWRKVAAWSDDRLVEAIVEDGIDILVDLSGHSANNRLPVFARRPAPIGVTWLGYSGTTGVDGIDYLIGDRLVAPPGTEAQFSEVVWRLPDSYLCFAPPLQAPPVEPLPALTAGRIVFGSFNTLNKLSPPAIAAWAKILRAVPGSQLLLKNRILGLAGGGDVLKAQFAEAGIGNAQLVLRGHVEGVEGHLATYGEVDIALDPFPYNGTTTTCEAMWMGVPVLTVRGDRFVARVGESLLQTVGLPGWVADDLDDYVRNAVRLAGDLEELADLRASLRNRMAASPLTDAPRFARHLEAAFRGMWEKWCAAQPALSGQPRLD